MKTNHLKTFALVFCCLFTRLVLAQQENTSFAPLSVGLQLGLIATGPSHRIYDFMERNGFGQTGGFFSINYPRKVSVAGALDIRYELNTLFSLKGSFFLMNSWVVGHDSFRRWRLDMDVASPALLGIIQTRNRVFYAGMGPSVNFIQFKSTKFSSVGDDIYQDKFQKVGWVVESGFRFPAKSRFFGDVQMRYAFVGAKKEGSFHFTGQSLFTYINGVTASNRTVSAYEVPYNTFSFNLGGGMRVGKLPAR